MKILFLPGSKYFPPARYRLGEYVEPLKEKGCAVEVRLLKPDRLWQSSLPGGLSWIHNKLGTVMRVASVLWMTRDAEKFDVIMMNRDLLPELRIDFLEPWLARRNPALVFDFDDAIHLGLREKKLRKILPHFGCIVAGNQNLAEFGAEISPDRVYVLPTVVNTQRLFPPQKRAPGPLRIGWSGSTFTARESLPILKNILVRLAKEVNFEFVYICNSEPEVSWEGVKSRYIAWSEASENEGLQQMDIGLMPLEDTPFQRGKCGLKAIQYMAVGIPAVVSPVGANRTIVVDGQTGFHCRNEDEWVGKLRQLSQNEAQRLEMGRRARRHVEQHFSVEYAVPKLLSILETASKQKKEGAIETIL